MRAPSPCFERTALVGELMREVRRSSADLGRALPAGTALPGQSAAGGAPWTPRKVLRVLGRRRAVHEFASLTCTADQLLRALAEGRSTDRALWPEDCRDAPVELVVAAWRVADLPQGLYRLTADLDLRLLPARDGVTARPSARDFVIQAEFAETPAMVFAGGDLGAALRTYGQHGHRVLATRAAAALHTAWLTTVALGGHGCMFGGVVDAAVRDWAGADGHHRSLVVGAAFGYLPPSSAS